MACIGKRVKSAEASHEFHMRRLVRFQFRYREDRSDPRIAHSFDRTTYSAAGEQRCAPGLVDSNNVGILVQDTRIGT